MDAQGYGRSLKNAMIALAVVAALVGGVVVGLLVWVFK